VPPNASRGMAEGPPSFLLPPERGLLLLLHLLLTQRLTTCPPRRRSDTMDTLRHGCCLLGSPAVQWL